MNLILLLRGFASLGILPAEALDAAGGIHQLLFAGKERMATRADFNADVASVSRPGHKNIAARAMHAHIVISGMNGCFHMGLPSSRTLRFYRNSEGFSNGQAATSPYSCGLCTQALHGRNKYDTFTKICRLSFINPFGE